MNAFVTPFLEIKELRHDYRQPDGSYAQALRLDHLLAARGEALAVTGPSGSGKTTLLHILAALIRPTCGEVLFDGHDLFAAGHSAARWRSLSVGYVFQEMNLLPDFSVLENLLLAAEISSVPKSDAGERADSLLHRLDLWDHRYSRPSELSLGEQQRTAVARAVIHSPAVVLADEPTASLDAENAGVVMDLLMGLCAESQTLLIAATHDEAMKKRFERVVNLRRPVPAAVGPELVSSREVI
ncbi:MAG: ABC transporter ATP-binding protein [Synergistaceae bacterium]|jgi:ABC-type lipoprotein export system ATPase subunit|nr:ABC transporter ATP-binding protein [Synergistaceae bacterium]